MRKAISAKVVPDIYDLVSLANRPPLDLTTADGAGVRRPMVDFEVQWHSSALKTKWLRKYKAELFRDQRGRNLWEKLLSSGIDPVELLEAIAWVWGDNQFKAEHARNLSVARLAKPYVAKSLRALTKIKIDLDTVRPKPTGLLFLPNPSWPQEMLDYETALSSSISLLEELALHYKPFAHKSRTMDSHEGYSVAAKILSKHCTGPECLELLNAGARAFGHEVGSDELAIELMRDIFRSSEALYAKG